MELQILLMRKRLKPFWIIFTLWIVALLIVNPIGNFPLNDDWAYALSVKGWLETGQFEIIDWPAMSLFSHVAWGTLWSAIFGFSFTTLRFSVLLLAAFSIWIFSLILRELNFSKEQQLLALATIVFNPLFFHLSNTFMTDVSFLSFCIISSYGFLCYFNSEKWYWLLLAIAFSVLAILVRQLGLLIPVSFGVAMVARKCSISSMATAVSGMLITYGSLRGYTWWLEDNGGLPASFVSIESVLDRLSPSVLWRRSKELLGFYFIYLGGYLLPLLLYSARRIRNRFTLTLFFIFLPILGFFIISCWDRLPMINTIYNFGIGPMNLPDFLEGLSSMTVLSSWQVLVIKLAALLGAVLLLWSGVAGLHRMRKLKSSRLPQYYFKLGVLIFILSYVFYLVIDKYNFDRYMLPLILFAIILLPRSEGIGRKFSFLVLLPLIFFAIGGTHDYLSWNKARWQGLNALTERGIRPNEIDGGFEFNGWHQTHHLNPFNRFSKSWWFVDDDRYAVAFTPYKNYETIATYPFKKFLTFGVDSVLVLQREDFNKATSIIPSEPSDEDSLFVNYQKEDYVVDDQSGGFKSVNASSYHISSERKYFLDHKLFPVKPFEKVSISFDLLGDKKSFVVVNSAPTLEDFYYVHEPYVISTDKDNWQSTVVEMELPEDYPSDTLDIYFWKQKENQNLDIRNFKLEWKRY